jgi:hypothetical protein
VPSAETTVALSGADHASSGATGKEKLRAMAKELPPPPPPPLLLPLLAPVAYVMSGWK